MALSTPIDTLHATLDRTRLRWRAVRRTERVLAGAGAMGAVALAIIALDAWLRLPVWGRWAGAGALLGAALALLISFRLDARMRRRGRVHAAAMLERAGRLDAASIIAGAQLAARAGDGSAAATLSRRAVERAGRLASTASLGRVVPTARLRRRASAACIIWLALIAVAIIEPRLLTAAIARVVDPTARLPAWSPVAVALVRPTEEVRVGDDLRIDAIISGASPTGVSLELLPDDRAGSDPIDAVRMRSDAGAWTATLRNLREPVYLVATTGDAESAPIRIAPSPRPRVERATVTLTGAGGDQRVLAIDPGATIETQATVGDRIELRVAASLELSGASVSGANESTLDGRAAVAAMQPTEPGVHTLSLRPIGPTGLPASDDVAVRVVVSAPAEGSTAGARADGEASAAESAGAGEGGSPASTAAGAPAPQGPNIASRAADGLPPPPAPDGVIADGSLLAIERRARETGALLPGGSVRRVPAAYRDRVGAYFLRVLREEQAREADS